MGSKDLQTFVRIQDLKLRAKINTAKAKWDTQMARDLERGSRGDEPRTVYSSRADPWDDYSYCSGADGDWVGELKFMDEPR